MLFKLTNTTQAKIEFKAAGMDYELMPGSSHADNFSDEELADVQALVGPLDEEDQQIANQDAAWCDKVLDDRAQAMAVAAIETARHNQEMAAKETEDDRVFKARVAAVIVELNTPKG